MNVSRLERVLMQLQGNLCLNWFLAVKLRGEILLPGRHYPTTSQHSTLGLTHGKCCSRKISFWIRRNFQKKNSQKLDTVLRFRKSNISGSISKVCGNLSTLIRKNWTSKKHDSFTSWMRLTRNAIYTLQEREIVTTKLFRTYHWYRFSKCHLFSEILMTQRSYIINIILWDTSKKAS